MRFINLLVWLLFLLVTVDAQPGKSWLQDPHPEASGWDLQKLALLKKYLADSTQITGYMVVRDDRVIFEFGDISEVSYIASCRKSVLAILYGAYIKSGKIKLHSTLAELKMNDVGGLSNEEKKATVQDLLSARSGVFHAASYPGDYLGEAPIRGSVVHGAYWLYSNWDFNAAGYVFEQQTHQNIYDEITRTLALPLEMQDWNRTMQHKEGDFTKSI